MNWQVMVTFYEQRDKTKSPNHVVLEAIGNTAADAMEHVTSTIHLHWPHPVTVIRTEVLQK